MPIKFATVEEEYVKNPDIRKSDVLALQEWVNKQPHLPNMTEFEVILFLQSCLNKSEAAKTAIENYYTFRTQHPDLFSNRNPRTIYHCVIYSVLPKTPTGELIMYSRLYDMNVDNWDFKESIILFDMVRSLTLAQYGTATGCSLIVDTEGISLSYAMKINIATVAKVFQYLQEAIPVKLKHVHVINGSSVLDKLVSIVRPFIKKEIFELIKFHKTLDTLYPFVPNNILPKELGGEHKCFSELIDETKQNLIDNEQYFKEEELKVVDESKRIEPRKNTEISSGIEGTFKRLDID